MIVDIHNPPTTPAMCGCMEHYAADRSALKIYINGDYERCDPTRIGVINKLQTLTLA